jgi:coproporphyrinogen III oxidase-like Fe-S oxidoreductase
MNRDHRVSEAVDLIRIASLTPRLRSFSVDLIFGRPSQSVEDWKAELGHLLDSFPNIPHISLYELTVERGTRLWKDVQRGAIRLPGEEELASMYEVAIDTLKVAGLGQYEVSNFSRGKVHEGRHNSWYWRGGDFIGVGPGAHGRYHNIVGTRLATVQTPLPDNWMRAVETFGHGTRKVTEQQPLDIFDEVLSASLRTRWGMESSTWAQVGLPLTLSDVVSDDEVCQSFISNGTLVSTSGCLRLSEQGLRLADHVIPSLMANVRKKLQA